MLYRFEALVWMIQILVLIIVSNPSQLENSITHSYQIRQSKIGLCLTSMQHDKFYREMIPKTHNMEPKFL